MKRFAVTHLMMVAVVLCSGYQTACLPTIPTVTVTPANSSQVQGCESIGNAHNDLLIASVATGAVTTGVGIAAAGDTNTNQKTGFSIGAAIGAAGLTAFATFIGLESTAYANDQCSTVVGPLIPLPAAKSSSFPPDTNK